MISTVVFAVPPAARGRVCTTIGAGIKTLAFAVFALLSGRASEAHLVNFKFLKPIVIGDVVICVENDMTRAVSVSTEGKTLWKKNSRKPFASSGDPFVLMEGPDSSLLFQRFENKDVFNMDPRSGRLTRRFTLASRDDLFWFDSISKILFARNMHEEETVHVLDADTGGVLWRTAELTGIVGGHGTNWFIFSGPSTGKGFFRKSVRNTIQSISKVTGKVSWQRAVPETGSAVLIWPHLVLENEGKLTVLAADTGALIREFATQEPVIQILNFEPLLVYTTGASRSGFDQDTVIHFCSLPDFREQKKVTLKETSGGVTLWRDFIIVDSDRRTICFRGTGEKIWEKGHMDRTDVIDGKIYFTDNPNQVARIGIIDVATGAERILHRELWKLW